MNNADTAANAAIAASGETPNKIAVGYNAFAVAACEYSNVLAKNKMTAKLQGYCCKNSADTALI